MMALGGPGLIFALSAAGAAAGYAAFRAGRRALRPAMRRRRFERVIREGTSFVPVRALGIGREGAVFEVEASPDNPGGERRALKARNPTAPRKHAARMEKLNLKMAALGGETLDAAPCMMRIFGAGEIRDAEGLSAYQLMELIDGETVGERARRLGARGEAGPAGLERAIELLDSCLALERAGLHVVHADPDNLMIDGEGRLRLIDLEGLYLGELSAQDRMRQLKRLSRSILCYAGESWGEGADGEALLARLRAHARSGKRSPPPAPLAFASLAEMRDALARARDAIDGHGPALDLRPESR